MENKNENRVRFKYIVSARYEFVLVRFSNMSTQLKSLLFLAHVHKGSVYVHPVSRASNFFNPFIAKKKQLHLLFGQS